uniref:Uncharacterized protein n=1 Tax=Micrurus lemniscatus lemniscatus TaxID=129467 RepID=A0A2D4I496_MICLE
MWDELMMPPYAPETKLSYKKASQVNNWLHFQFFKMIEDGKQGEEYNKRKRMGIFGIQVESPDLGFSISCQMHSNFFIYILRTEDQSRVHFSTWRKKKRQSSCNCCFFHSPIFRFWRYFYFMQNHCQVFNLNYKDNPGKRGFLLSQTLFSFLLKSMC